MIFILELVCSPMGHCLESIAWDDETHSENAAAFKLGLLSTLTLPVCGTCGSTSTLLRNLPTQYQSVEEATRSRQGLTGRCPVLTCLAPSGRVRGPGSNIDPWHSRRP